MTYKSLFEKDMEGIEALKRDAELLIDEVLPVELNDELIMDLTEDDIGAWFSQANYIEDGEKLLGIDVQSDVILTSLNEIEDRLEYLQEE